MTNIDNEKGTMAQTFSCDDSLKGLKDPKKCLNAMWTGFSPPLPPVRFFSIAPEVVAEGL